MMEKVEVKGGGVSFGDKTHWILVVVEFFDNNKW